MKRNMRRLLVCGLAFSVLLTTLFLQVGYAKVTRITYWNCGGVPAAVELNRERAEEFNRTHTDIQIDYDQIEWQGHQEKLVTAYLSKKGPDVVFMHFSMIPKLGGMGVLADLDKITGIEAVKGQFSDASIYWGQYKGTQYGITGVINPFIMIAHRGLFNEAGLVPPKTLAELRDYSKKLTRDKDGDGADDQWGMALEMGHIEGGMIYRWIPYLHSAGGAILNDEMTEAVFNTTGGAEVTQMFVDMYNVDKSVPPSIMSDRNDDCLHQFLNGTVAMHISGPWYVGVFENWKEGFAEGEDNQIIVAEVPRSDPAIGPYSQGTLLEAVTASISETCKDKEAALVVLDWMIGTDAQKTWTKPIYNQLPTIPAVFNDPVAIEGFPAIPLYGKMAATARPWPIHAKVYEMQQILTRAILSAMLMEKDVQTLMDEAAEDINELLK